MTLSFLIALVPAAAAEDRIMFAAPVPGAAPAPIPRPDPLAAPFDATASGPEDDVGGSGEMPYRRPLLPPEPLRIVSWHLDDAKTAGALAMLPEPDRAWRHTFGAERYTPPVSTFDPATFTADVVLIQGLRRAGDARLLFPARHWRLIVSRQALAPVLPRGADGGDAGIPRPAPTTAIAIRLQRRLRITGREHIAEVVVPRHEPTGPSETAAALAVRLIADGRPVWVIAADLPENCAATPATGAGAAPCPALDALARWRNERATGIAVALGGRNVRGNRSAPPGACGSQAIVYPGGGADIEAHDEPGLGCIARLVWP
ncbi:MAG: hypothetical protein JNM89_06385 [Hyphomicrobiaceae bacterium]|nr:hypothetical protein [Hyphomicrobiaceae bacterium]